MGNFRYLSGRWSCHAGDMLCVAALLWIGLAQAHGAVVTDKLISGSSRTQPDVPVTFGQVFKKGDVPRGASLMATLDGRPVALQVDPKATNPDGSLRHAVLTVMVPSLSGNTESPLALSAQSPTSTAAKGAPVSLAQLLATGYDAEISLILEGTPYTASARKLLQTANTTHSCEPWGTTCNIWLSGPLAGEWVVNGPVATSNGTTSPNLRIYFAVRAYAGPSPGTVGPIRTDIIVENTSAFAPQAQPQYTATLTSGKARYTSPALTQYTATRWHKVLWWNSAQPKVYVQQDTQYIQNSLAISRYMKLKPSEKFLASLRQSCAPLDHCDQTNHMANAGAQQAIGPLPRWDTLYVIDPDARAYRWMLANADALGTYSVHYRDAATGYPVSIRKHPYVTITNWAYANNASRQSSTKGQRYKADLLPGCVNSAVVTDCKGWYGTGNPWLWDNAHQPSWAYVPYMVTGSYYYMSELAFNASYNEIWSNADYREYAKGLIDRPHSQVRGKAWVLRNMAEAAWLLPDRYPLKAEFTADVDNSLKDWNQKYTNNPQANPLHTMDFRAGYSVNGGKNNATTSWQHNFLTWSAGHAAELGFVGATEFHKWLAPFEISLMTDWQSNPTQGYCWLEASAYAIVVKDGSGKWLPSFTAAYAATFPSLVGLACNSPEMVAAMGKLEKRRWQKGEMHGYPDSATGFPANFQIGIAAAADSGLPKALEAWQLFESRSVKPTAPHAYDNYPNFAVFPRSATQ